MSGNVLSNRVALVLWLSLLALFTTSIVGRFSRGEIAPKQSKQAQKTTRYVLFVFSDNVRTPWGREQDRALRQTLAGLNEQVEIFTENLDNIRTGEGGYDKLQADFFREKYKNIHFDVIIAIKPAALKFLLDHRADAFGNSPMVFCDVGAHEKVLEDVGTSVPGCLNGLRSAPLAKSDSENTTRYEACSDRVWSFST